MKGFSNLLRRYGPAVVSCGVALAVAWPLDAPVSCFLLAVMVSSLYGGRGPGLLSVALSCLAFDYFFLPPRFQFFVGPSTYLRFAAFVGAALTAFALIEAKRRVEESRREIHRRYGIITGTAPYAIITIDQHGRIRFVNPATSKMFGWAAPELIGQAFTILMPRFQLAERMSRTECVGRRKDGTEFSVELSFGEVTGEDQSFTGFIRDLRERKRNEAALQKSEFFLAEAQKLNKTGSFGWNVSSGEWFWSQETLRIVGCDLNVEPFFELLFERIHPADRGRIQEMLHNASTSGDPLPARRLDRSIVEAHEGRLWATSAEGRGTTFSLTLPLVASAAQ
jgi:PAS domain S-box-containing protein